MALNRRPATLLPNPPESSTAPALRMVPRRGEKSILRVGPHTNWWGDLYHHALTARWQLFLLAAAAVYLGANGAFAMLYYLQPGAINGARPGVFSDAFFFSVQTMATIGYGQLAPQTIYANALMTMETLFGLLLLTLTTGLMFARVSRPTARVMFSRWAIIAPHDGVPTLSLRMANERRNQILQAEVTLTLVRDESTAEGKIMRRFHDLRLARARSPIFALSFTLLHTIDRDSPLWGATPQSLVASGAEIVVTGTGLDETMSQTIHARYSYQPDEILWDRSFVDIFGYTADGRRAIDFSRFHETEPLRAPT